MENYGKKGKIMKSTIVNVGVGFLLGATAIGGVATAANSEPIGVKACVDKKTQVMYLAANDKCISSRTLVSLGASSIDVKSIAALVTPSVVSIKVTTPSGSGSGSGPPPAAACRAGWPAARP